MKAMIFAAGFGTRLKPITDSKPKALVTFNGKTLLEYAILKLKHYGVTNIIVNVHHFSAQIIDFLNTHGFGVDITVSDESEALLNTGGGLYNVKEFFKGSEPFFVYNVDIISTIDLHKMLQFHKSNNALVTLPVIDRKTSRYLLFDSESNQLSAWENKSTEERITVHDCECYTSLAFSGIQIISPQLFDLVEENGAFPIMDLYLRLAKNEKILGYEHSNDFWLDVGKFNQLEDVEDRLAKQELEFI